jgi:hypothetical protein
MCLPITPLDVLFFWYFSLPSFFSTLGILVRLTTGFSASGLDTKKIKFKFNDMVLCKA